MTLALALGLAAPASAQGPDGAGPALTSSSAVRTQPERGRAATVGFRSFVLHDPARSYVAETGPASSSFPRPELRPIRVALWYPAERAVSAPVTRSDYLRLADEERALTDWSPAEVVAFEDSLVRALESRGIDPDRARARAEQPMEAEWEAPPADVAGPLVLYLPEIGESVGESAEALERLGADGAIVAALPSFGVTPDLEIRDEAGLEARARDAAFVLGVLLAEHAGRIDGVALVGRGWGAAAAAAVAMRRPEVEALVALGGSAGPFTSLADYDPTRVLVPLLSVRSESLADAIPFAGERRIETPPGDAPPRLEGRVEGAVRAFLSARAGGADGSRAISGGGG
ncbi:MAG: hypothetical protein R3326_04355 [Gemmatimonadota bacterium]|nr:hypothetical protein [Gemmatimonadota bacterium]